MTTAPPNLIAVRTLLLDHLPLSGTAVGIVGDTAHVSEGNSYHLGRPEQATTGYAATESSRDKAGLCEFASALDEGWWELRVAGKTHNLRTHSVWMVAQCKANAPDTRDIREIIYSPDGHTVKRWDRLGRRTTGDSSHLSHTHRSYFRDATKSGRDLTALDRRYLTEIGLIAPEVPDMDQHDKLVEKTDQAGRTVGQVLADLENLRNWLVATPAVTGVGAPGPSSRLALLAAVPARLDKVESAVEKLATPQPIDYDQLARAILRVAASPAQG